MYHRMHSVLTHQINTILGSLLLASFLLLALSVIVRAKQKEEQFMAVAHQRIPEEVRLVKNPAPNSNSAP
ncbi:MAG: hypothetical protein KatS3mg100_581 [Candidatus Parcubacteria bacterium]|nr:MAG: hypothetical protein KatS3mg100_581 [Candidatus Parcubacteria bacterium]